MNTIVWFRNDLRTSDNPALAAAAGRGAVVPVYIMEARPWAPGGASRWWLHHGLAALRDRLGGLLLLRGEAGDLLTALAKRAGADMVVWNRRYAPRAWRRKAYEAVKA